jgi:hypothetical protein
MTEKRQDQTGESTVRARGDSAYLEWLGAAIESKHALRAWLDGPPRDEQVLYAIYTVALDREEAAASVLERFARAGERRVVAHRNPGRGHRYEVPIVQEMPQPRAGAE